MQPHDQNQTHNKPKNFTQLSNIIAEHLKCGVVKKPTFKETKSNRGKTRFFSASFSLCCSTYTIPGESWKIKSEKTTTCEHPVGSLSFEFQQDRSEVGHGFELDRGQCGVDHGFHFIVQVPCQNLTLESGNQKYLYWEGSNHPLYMTLTAIMEKSYTLQPRHAFRRPGSAAM